MALKSTSVPLRPPRLQDHSPHGPSLSYSLLLLPLITRRIVVVIELLIRDGCVVHRRVVPGDRVWMAATFSVGVIALVYEDEGAVIHIACVWHTTYQHCMRPFIQWQTPRSTVMLHSFLRSSLRACVHACIRVVVDSTTRDGEHT